MLLYYKQANKEFWNVIRFLYTKNQSIALLLIFRYMYAMIFQNEDTGGGGDNRPLQEWGKEKPVLCILTSQNVRNKQCVYHPYVSFILIKDKLSR